MSRDPDLDMAITDMAPVVARIRSLEEELANNRHEGALLKPIMHLEVQRADQIGALRLRAEKLNLPWRSLMMIVEEANFLRQRTRRKPALPQVLVAVKAAVERTELDATEAVAELKLAEARQRLASSRATAASAALAYMRAS